MIKSLEILQTKFTKKSWCLSELRDKVLSEQVASPIITAAKIEWSQPQASLYIETIILGFPLHQIILAANEDSETLDVIDGCQRIAAIMHFFGEQLHNQSSLRLQGLQVRTELNGMTYQEIQANALVPDLTATFDRKLLDVTIIENSSPKIIQEVQTRINL